MMASRFCISICDRLLSHNIILIVQKQLAYRYTSFILQKESSR